MSEHQVAVIGAGPAGISVALSLRDRGLRPLLIDCADEVGSAWRGRYDKLKLNTGRPFSHLPNRRYPQGTPMFPSRDQVVAHLDRHAHEDGIELRLGTTVNRIDRGRAGGACAPPRATSTRLRWWWQPETSTRPRFPSGPEWTGTPASCCIRPVPESPPVPGQEGVGRRLRVIGYGDRARPRDRGAAKTWMAVRTPPNIMLRSLPGGLSADVIALPLYQSRSALRTRSAGRHVGRISATSANSGCRFPRRACTPGWPVSTRCRRWSTWMSSTPSGTDRSRWSAPSSRSTATRSNWWTDRGWTPTSSSVRPATGAIWNPWSATSACSTPTASHSSRVRARRRGLRFIGFMSRPSFIGYVAKQSKRMAKRIEPELSAAEVLRLEHQVGEQRLVLDVRLVLDGVPQLRPAARACIRGTSGAPGIRTLSATTMEPGCSQPRSRMLCRSGR